MLSLGFASSGAIGSLNAFKKFAYIIKIEYIMGR